MMDDGTLKNFKKKNIEERVHPFIKLFLKKKQGMNIDESNFFGCEEIDELNFFVAERECQMSPKR